jgi:hypothetical protein
MKKESRVARAWGSQLLNLQLKSLGEALLFYLNAQLEEPHFQHGFRGESR